MRWADIIQAILVCFARLSLGKSPVTWFKAVGHSDKLSSQIDKVRSGKFPTLRKTALSSVICFTSLNKKKVAEGTVLVDNQKKNSNNKLRFILSGGRTLKHVVGKYTGLNKLFSFVASPFSPKPKKRILILMSDTGGGHRASAQALDQALSDLFPGRMEVKIVDLWSEHGKWPFNGFVTSYRFLAKHPILWRVMYSYGIFPPTKLFSEVYSRIVCYDHFKYAIESADPDMVVSVHPLCQHIPIPIVQNMNTLRAPGKLPIPFVTVVTDLGGAHPTWFHKGSDRIYVASESVRQTAIKKGIAPEKIALYGLPVRPSFWKPNRPKNSLRKDLGLMNTVKTVLLMGGGDGVGGLSAIACEIGNRLGQSSQNSQMVVVCGHNKQMATSLSSRIWPKNVNVVVKGFCNNIDDFMSASDCLVTKAGPGTIAEAMIRGLPIVLSSFLPGQEEGNVPYVVDGGFGVYTGNRPVKVADAVSKFFSDEAMLQRMSRLARAQSHQDATTAIARDMGCIVLTGQPPLTTTVTNTITATTTVTAATSKKTTTAATAVATVA
eukprot:gene6788-13747_t